MITIRNTRLIAPRLCQRTSRDSEIILYREILRYRAHEVRSPEPGVRSPESGEPSRSVTTSGGSSGKAKAPDEPGCYSRSTTGRANAYVRESLTFLKRAIAGCKIVG